MAPATATAPPAQLPLYATLASSAAAACWAETLSLPVDTAKVRLQLQGAVAGGKYSGLVGTMSTIVREEGAAALWKGLTPGLHRQCLFGGLRIGMYEVRGRPQTRTRGHRHGRRPRAEAAPARRCP